jgi:hypothetical protein
VSESAAAPGPVVGSTAEEHAHAVGRLRRSSLSQLLLLVLQTGLGMGVNIYISLPAADQGKGLMASFGDSIAKGPAAVAVHAIFGMLVFINACVLVVFSLTVRSAAVKVCSVVGWLCIAGAAMSGASFVNANQNSGNSANTASLTMALLTLVALACYAVNLFVLGGQRDEVAA